MYEVLYKCRMCQQIFTGAKLVTREEAVNSAMLLGSYDSTSKHAGQLILEMRLPHTCFGNDIGMCDLIGFKYYPDPPTNPDPSMVVVEGGDDAVAEEGPNPEGQ